MGDPDEWKGPREEAIMDLFEPGLDPKYSTNYLRPRDCWANTYTQSRIQCGREWETVVGLCHEHFEEIIGGQRDDEATAAPA